jgi:S1-C subfamily serine protease
MLVICIGSLLNQQSIPAKKVQVSTQQPSTEHSTLQMQKLAKSITVKVLSKGFLGTGVLIKRQGSVYTVLTNAHVVRAGEKPYQIQTPDGKIHTALVSKPDQPLHKMSRQDNDLALLLFRSRTVHYAVASLGSASSLNIGNDVFAAGFPFDSEGIKDTGFVFKSGKISLVLDKALAGGYRLGYTNDIQLGMSGGPLLNRAGKVVAINGIHAEPLWGEPYMYQDGTEPEPSLRKQLAQYSWGIPIETFLQMEIPSVTATKSRF